MATPAQITQLAVNWSQVIQAHMEATHSARLEFVPKGDPDSVTTLLANWPTAIPNTYPEPTEAQLLTALATVEAAIVVDDATDAIEAEAEAGFTNIPNWASWTAAEAEAWVDTNVTDLASAKIVLKKQTLAIMWLADKVFPNRR